MYFAATLVRKRCGVESVSVFACCCRTSGLSRTLIHSPLHEVPVRQKRQKHLKWLTYSTKVYSNFLALLYCSANVFQCVWGSASVWKSGKTNSSSIVNNSWHWSTRSVSKQCRKSALSKNPAKAIDTNQIFMLESLYCINGRVRLYKGERTRDV